VSNLFFLAATHFLALVGLTSALAKMIQEPDPFRSHQHWILAIANTRWFALVELGIGAILLLPIVLIAQAGAAIVLAIVIIDGQFLHAKHPEEESEGFGSLTPNNQVLYFAIGTVVAVATVFVALKALQTPVAEMPINAWFTGITLAILIIIERKLRYDQSRGQGYAKKTIDVAAVSELPADLCIGKDALGASTTGELVAAGKPVLIVGISPHSSQCRDTYALLACHAKLLSRDLTIAVIAENDELYRTTPNVPMRQLLDPHSHLSRFLSLRVRPYALLVNRDLSLLAPPSQAAQKVQRLITLLVTTIQNAPETYLTLGDDDQRQR
jgi:hypothetical protein